MTCTALRRGLISYIVVMTAVLSGCFKSTFCSEPGEFPAKSQTPMAAASVYVSDGDSFRPGSLSVRTCDVEPSEFQAPARLRLHAPEPAGAYPVVMFQHGFMVRNAAYDEILQHLASHGFVVIAPQMYEPGLSALMGRPTGTEEAQLAGEILRWLPGNLDRAIGYTARTDRVGVAGHSRGGTVAWSLASAHPSVIGALAGVDPVGRGGPRVKSSTLPVGIPSMILGAGRGGGCAPEGRNHVQFYEASPSPAWHIVALDHGHGDMLDDREAALAAWFCASGPDRAGMRRLTAGLLTALFRGALQENPDAWLDLSRTEAFPVAASVESK